MSRMLTRFLPSRRSRPQARTFRPALETLEDRTVLSPVFLVAPNQAVDSAHVANLNTAIKNAGPGGTVQVEPGAIGGSFTLQQTNTPFDAQGITFQGDPNVAASSLPLLNLYFDNTIGAGGTITSYAASGVTLLNLNLGAVYLDAFANGENILNSMVSSITIKGGSGTAFNNGNNVISGNTIIGSIRIGSLPIPPFPPFFPGSPGGFSANDIITNNLVEGPIHITNDAGVQLEGNTVLFISGSSSSAAATGGLAVSSSGQAAITVIDSQSANIEGNNVTVNFDPATLSATPAPYSTVGINLVWSNFFPTGAAKGAVVQLNTISTNNVQGGAGLVIEALSTDKDQNVQVIVQGNDFHQNSVGAVYLAANDGSSFGTTFGGPAQAGSAVSLGGNDFRGTNVAIAVATKGGANLTNANAVLDAQYNIFTTFTSTPNVIVPANGTATGTINTSNPLTGNQAFVQVLYEKLLGAVVDLGQLNGWVNILASAPTSSAGQELVAVLFEYSPQGLGHLIDSLSISLFGHTLTNTAFRSGFIAELQQGMSLETVEGQLISLPDYFSATGGNVLNTAFQQLTGLTVTPQISQALAQAQFQQGSNGQPNGVFGVATAILESLPGRTLAVSQLFQEFYHRFPTGNEVSFNVLFGGPLLNIEYGLLSTSEFFNFAT